MRRILTLLSFLLITATTFAQSDSATKKAIVNTRSTPRSADHFMLQFGYLTWNGKPDSINTGGIPRTANVYFLFDFPFKTNPKMSAALGAGFGTDHMFFDKTNVGIKDRTTNLVFRNASDTNYFKKYKLSTVYLEAPIELRFTSNPDNNKRSVKAALGVKIGTLLSAHVKGKNLLSRSGATVNEYKMKEHSKEFFNKNRVSATARVGLGNFSLFGAYQVTPLFKEGVGPKINPLAVGLTLSGL
jgi:hypothetical protein